MHELPGWCGRNCLPLAAVWLGIVVFGSRGCCLFKSKSQVVSNQPALLVQRVAGCKTSPISGRILPDCLTQAPLKAVCSESFLSTARWHWVLWSLHGICRLSAVVIPFLRRSFGFDCGILLIKRSIYSLRMRIAPRLTLGLGSQELFSAGFLLRQLLREC